MPLVLPAPTRSTASTSNDNNTNNNESNAHMDIPDPSPLADLIDRSIKRTHEVFLANFSTEVPVDPPSQRIKLATKMMDEYAHVRELPAVVTAQTKAKAAAAKAAAAASMPPPSSKPSGSASSSSAAAGGYKGVVYMSQEAFLGSTILTKLHSSQTGGDSQNIVQSLISDIADTSTSKRPTTTSTALTIRGTPAKPEAGSSSSLTALVRIKDPRKIPRPDWHAPWKLMRVISGHLGWVRSIAVDPSNEWFATGAGDRVIKIWDLASGVLKLTLTGHIASVRGLAVSNRHPYLFSGGEDKMVKCWDLEYNKVIRHYHGHLSGVYSLALHPTLDVLVTGGRDSTARVWDMRTKAQIFALTGHQATVTDIKTQEADPQIITASSDSTVKLWDLAAGRTMSTLTHHKKGVRALATNPNEFTFVSGSSDNIKQWKCPEGSFIQNLSGHNAIINTMCVNNDNVLFSGGDNGSMYFWDYRSGYNFQTAETIVQPGSLESENGIFCSAFDRTGLRLITGEGDKTIKIWKEDERATPETHPINFKPEINRPKY
ncbi:pre-mRNA-splicing factor prp46 [Blyttiomyces sp. JEL0837]|nr:pre-mRNA-splicing factor prp46 [Blyttiomyces sp. JEL0837]